MWKLNLPDYDGDADRREHIADVLEGVAAKCRTSGVVSGSLAIESEHQTGRCTYRLEATVDPSGAQ